MKRVCFMQHSNLHERMAMAGRCRGKNSILIDQWQSGCITFATTQNEWRALEMATATAAAIEFSR